MANLDDVLSALKDVIVNDTSAACYWCQGNCGGTCLGLTSSTQMKPDDPAYWMLKSGKTSVSQVFDGKCYICNDPEYAQMGMSLCQPCVSCTEKAVGEVSGHVPADDTVCSVCGVDAYALWEEEQSKKANENTNDSH